MQLDHYRTLGRSGLRVSPVCLGTMTFGKDWGWGSDADEARQVFDAYLERGGNYLDTANFYTGGSSETLLGQFARGRRDRLVIASKYSLCTDPGDPNAGGNHRKNLRQSVDASLPARDPEEVAAEPCRWPLSCEQAAAGERLVCRSSREPHHRLFVIYVRHL